MKTTNPTRISALALPLLCGALFTGCLTMPETTHDDDLGRLAVEIIPGPVSQSRDLRLEEMTVTLVSSAGDTLRDTITDAGSRLSKFPVRLNAPDGFRIVHPVYALDPAKEWTIGVKTRDGRDSVVHVGSARAGSLAAGSLRNVPMRLASRFAAYEAVFSLPREAAARGYRLSRVKAIVDGVAACAADAEGEAARLTCDYLPVGNRTVTLEAYGQGAEGTGAQLLFKGAAEVNVATGDAPAENITLAAADTEVGEVAEFGMAVRLGAVGRITVNVITSGALEF